MAVETITYSTDLSSGVGNRDEVVKWLRDRSFATFLLTELREVWAPPSLGVMPVSLVAEPVVVVRDKNVLSYDTGTKTLTVTSS